MNTIELCIESTYLTKWQELNSNVNKKYDALLCRGNSFIYIDGYDVTTYNPLVIIENMKQSLGQFYNQLNENGVLYIDLLREDKIKSNNFIEGETICATYSYSSQIDYSEETNIRKNIEIIKSFKDDSVKKTVLYGYPISEEKLRYMLMEVGFLSIEKVEEEYSLITDAFLARK